MLIKQSTIINKALDDTVEYFLLDGKWKEWHQDLKDIKLVEGMILTQNAKYELKYENATHYATIIDIRLPNQIKYLFEIGNIKLEITYTFREHDDHVHFNADYNYKFNWTQILVRLISKSILTKHTKSEVDAIKEFIETN